MADVVYWLCFATSAACALLLARGYRRTRTPLLLWSSLCFIGLGLNNALLVIDFNFAPEANVAILRACVALVGVITLLIGLIWKVR